MARTKDGFPSPIETFGNYTPRLEPKCSGVFLLADPICKNGKWRDKEER